MQALISDISGKEIGKHLQNTGDAEAVFGGVIFHFTQEEHIEILEFIAKLQAERMPEKYSADFEPFTNARKFLDDFAARKKAAEERKAAGISPSVFDEDDDD